MSDIQIFHATLDGARELDETPFSNEKELQHLVERHLRDLTGIDFVKSEHRTGSRHRRRADTLGIDTQQRPVVIEYKLGQGGAAISQGLDYLFWLEDHKGDFRELVRDSLGNERSRNIDFRNARLLCIAGEFRREDIVSVETNIRRIGLLSVRRHGESAILLEWVYGGEEAPNLADGDEAARGERRRNRGAQEEHPVVEVYDFSIYERWDKADAELQELFMVLHRFVTALGKDVRVQPVKKYISYKRKRNAVDVQFRTQKKQLIVAVALDPDTVPRQAGFTRDVSKVGYPSPNNLEITISDHADLERAKPLIKRSYDETG